MAATRAVSPNLNLERVFESVPDCYVILASNLVIVAVSDA